jgi:D-inositol-3-phosphate glycosyltransferase
MSGIAALSAAGPLDIPVAHTFHALGLVKRRHQGAADTSPAERIPLETNIARNAHLVVATTTEERQDLIGLGADPTRVCVVPCGVDLTHFRPDAPAIATRTSRRRVVVVSRLVERKGIGNVIEAMAAVPDAELIIAGGPPAALLDEDVEASRFQALAGRLGLGDRVRLVGSVARDGVPDLIRSADVVACCPWYEPFGLVAVEAMACGVPVVASNVGGLAETVVDGVTGLLVPPRRPDRIAAAIERLLASAARQSPGRRAIRDAARRRARRYGWPQIARETSSALDRMRSSEDRLRLRAVRPA